MVCHPLFAMAHALSLSAMAARGSLIARPKQKHMLSTLLPPSEHHTLPDSLHSEGERMSRVKH